jgi:hypothetical protein
VFPCADDVENSPAWDEGIGAGHGPEKTAGGVARFEVSGSTPADARDKTIRLRMVATPPGQLKALLERMKILLPNRPKKVENVVEKMG